MEIGLERVDESAETGSRLSSSDSSDLKTEVMDEEEEEAGEAS